MTREEAFAVLAHPIPPRSHYKAARAARRRAVMWRVLGMLACLSIVCGGLYGWAA